MYKIITKDKPLCVHRRYQFSCRKGKRTGGDDINNVHLGYRTRILIKNHSILIMKSLRKGNKAKNKKRSNESGKNRNF